MNIYCYDACSHEYIEESVAREDPLEKGKYLIPANATIIAPPEYGLNTIPVFDHDNDVWSIIADYRNESWFEKSTGLEYQGYKSLGELPDQYTLLRYPGSDYKWDDPQCCWVYDESGVLERKWSEIRDKRNRLLLVSDWTQGNDANEVLTDLQITDFKTYRRILRDLPSNFSSPDDVVFPEIPV